MNDRHTQGLAWEFNESFHSLRASLNLTLVVLKGVRSPVINLNAECYTNCRNTLHVQNGMERAITQRLYGVGGVNVARRVINEHLGRLYTVQR
jgi:hypothetical protein